MIVALTLLLQDRIGTGVGMRFQETDDGIKILTVREGSPAEKAGFKKDDLVVLVNGKSRVAEQAFVMGIWTANKKPATLTIRRGDEELELKVTATELDAEPAVGGAAPDFTLKSPDGKSDVTLSKLVGKKPVVLVFGSYT